MSQRQSQIYGKRRGITLHEYAETPPQYNIRLDAAYCRAVKGQLGKSLCEGDGKEEEGGEESPLEGEEEDVASLPSRSALTDPSLIFTRICVWEGSGEVPDPDVIKARDEEEEAAREGKRSEEDECSEGKEGELDEQVVDITGGEGYTQVYLVMSPSPTAIRTPVALEESSGGGTAFLVPRTVAFRFGNWVYGGEVSFPVENLHLRDVPYVLPALQKQQGRLGYISEANSMPINHSLTPTLTQFMAAVAILKSEMEDCQEEVGVLAASSENSWIDEESAASFFELSFRASSVQGKPADATSPSSGLRGVEVIAAKVYLTGNGGMVLHVVWFRNSLYCVLADNTEDLPLLDVAFPDVTARNRAVQVKEYSQRTAEKLALAFPGAPLPKTLRVWEGRRKGVYFPPQSLKAGEIKEQDVAPQSNSISIGQPSNPSTVAETFKASPTQVTPASLSASELDDLYDMGGLSSKISAGGIAASGGGSTNEATPATSVPSTSTSSAPTSAASQKSSSQIFSGSSRAPHFVAPLSGGSKVNSEEVVGVSGLARLIKVGGGKEDEAAPWDASGKPRTG